MPKIVETVEERRARIEAHVVKIRAAQGLPPTIEDPELLRWLGVAFTTGCQPIEVAS